MWGQTDRQTHRHINTITRASRGVGQSENQGRFLTPKKKRELNRGRFLIPKKEPMREPSKELIHEPKPKN